MQRDLLRKLELLRPSLERQGVAHLIVFGSRARGTAGPASDLDVAIELAPGASFSIIDLVGVEQLISDSTGVAANAFMRRSLDAAFVKDIERDGVAVF